MNLKSWNPSRQLEKIGCQWRLGDRISRALIMMQFGAFYWHHCIDKTFQLHHFDIRLVSPTWTFIMQTWFFSDLDITLIWLFSSMALSPEIDQIQFRTFHLHRFTDIPVLPTQTLHWHGRFTHIIFHQHDIVSLNCWYSRAPFICFSRDRS